MGACIRSIIWKSVAIYAICIAAAFAQEQQKTITFTSGTGFYVSSHHLITNEHVVHECDYIKVRGGVKPSFAQLIAVDKANDLALLKTNSTPTSIAALRGNSDISEGEDITILGYPLEHGITGKYLIRKGKVTYVQDPFGNKNHFLFTDSVEKGNSGGPIVDGNGTVIGVVVGKMSYYMEETKMGHTEHGPTKTASVAISLATLKNFLNQNNIFYHIDNLRYGYTASWLENKERRFVVNVHCIHQ